MSVNTRDMRILRLLMLMVLLFQAYGALLFADLGQNVTLPCNYHDSIASYFSWYKQVPWGQPRIIFSFNKHTPNTSSPDNELRDLRFSLHCGEGFCHLNISNVQQADSALYFCGQTSVTKTVIKEGTFLALKDSSRTSFLQQPDSLAVSTGGSATLRCTVLPGTKASDHSVYWFKQDSEQAHFGMLYIHSYDSSQCVQSSGSAARRCVYSFFKSNLSQFDSGMYYCAVASCGNIVFGNGTRLAVGGNQWETFPGAVHFVIAALLTSVFLNIFLFGFICQRRRKYPQTKGSKRQQKAPEDNPAIDNEESDAVQYVALDIKKGRGTSRRQRNVEEDTVYSNVRHADIE